MTICFAALSPLYLLALVALVVFSPFALVLSKPFRRNNYKPNISEYADQETHYSLNEMFSLNGFKRVVLTILFAVLSPLYIPYMLGLVFACMIGFILTRLSKRERNDMRHNNQRDIVVHSL
ncbi:MAG: hypothetical protein PHQ46_12265 [Negativicutes bacterium]|nr:hypothetical protein [Negativicutes bacterium]